MTSSCLAQMLNMTQQVNVWLMLDQILYKVKHHETLPNISNILAGPFEQSHAAFSPHIFVGRILNQI